MPAPPGTRVSPGGGVGRDAGGGRVLQDQKMFWHLYPQQSPSRFAPHASATAALRTIPAPMHDARDGATRCVPHVRAPVTLPSAAAYLAALVMKLSPHLGGKNKYLIAVMAIICIQMFSNARIPH